MNWILTFRGLSKDEVSAKLENDYLTISAAKGRIKTSRAKKGSYIPQR